MENNEAMIATLQRELGRLIDEKARVNVLAMRLRAALISGDAAEREALLRESEFLASPEQVAPVVARGGVAPINLNEQFTVTLTAFGAKQRNDHYAFVRNTRADIAPPLSSEGDVLTEPLWELFKVFGPAIGQAMEVPFVGNAITPAATPTPSAETIDTAAYIPWAPKGSVIYDRKFATLLSDWRSAGGDAAKRYAKKALVLDIDARMAAARQEGFREGTDKQLAAFEQRLAEARQEALAPLYDLFGIGSQARTIDILLTNAKNCKKFAEHLFAIEREFFMVPGEPDEDFPDEELDDECLLNCWGSTTEQYVEQFRAALASRDAAARAQARQEGIAIGRGEAVRDYVSLNDAPAAGIAQQPAQAVAVPDVKKMVDRFLGWPLPKSVLPDGCVMNRDYPTRCGTNLLTADEARQMFEYVLQGATPLATHEGKAGDGGELPDVLTDEQLRRSDDDAQAAAMQAQQAGKAGA